MPEILKARCIKDAQIQFVSLVDKAANKKTFLITKAADGGGEFSSFGKIIKTDNDNHYVTGVVYEPLTEDSQGDFMTEEEIQKAAVWFMKNGSGVDLQHDFKKFENAAVVESMVTKSDCVIGSEKIKKGTWLMTVEITDPDVWSAIEKGDITGFSMGGKGTYSEKDIPLDEPLGLLKRLAKRFGFDVVKSGFSDKYADKNTSSSFWDAFYSLQESLFRYDPDTGKNEPETDDKKIRECLSDFSTVIHNVLSGTAEPVKKAGKTLSSKNLEKLRSIYQSIGSLLQEADGTEENMTKAEVQELITKQVQAAVKKELPDTDNSGIGIDDGLDEKIKAYIAQTVKEQLEEAMKDKTEPEKEEKITKEEVAVMMKKALEPVYASRGIPTNLNNEPEPVEKNDDVFSGLFM